MRAVERIVAKSLCDVYGRRPTWVDDRGADALDSSAEEVFTHSLDVEALVNIGRNRYGNVCTF